MIPTAPTTAESTTADRRYPAPARQDPRQPWTYLAVTGAVGHGTPLTVTAWMRHGTGWTTAIGDLTSGTAAALGTVLSKVRGAASHATVLDLRGLTDLDSVGVQSVVIELRLSAGLRRRLDVVAPWTTPVQDGTDVPC